MKCKYMFYVPAKNLARKGLRQCGGDIQFYSKSRVITFNL